MLRPQRQPLDFKMVAVPSPFAVPSMRVPASWVWVIVNMVCCFSVSCCG